MTSPARPDRYSSTSFTEEDLFAFADGRAGASNRLLLPVIIPASFHGCLRYRESNLPVKSQLGGHLTWDFSAAVCCFSNDVRPHEICSDSKSAKEVGTTI